jgi:TRAP-type mannitol/chloroaromatic compound transport system permease small subunit
MLRLVRAIDAFSDLLGRGVAWLLVLMTLLTVVVVVGRYAFGLGAIVLQETVLYMHAAVFMLAAGYTLRHNGHVRVDILNARWPARRRAWVEVFGTLFFLLPVVVFIFWMSWDYVLASWSYHEKSTDGGLPFVYVLKTLLLLMPALLALQGLAELLRNLAFLGGHHPALYPETQQHGAGEL